ncbi:MAG: V-type ATPase subunit [Bacilli bacterium]|nr:V-type ATPase subunit [Bacilli bacterium]
MKNIFRKTKIVLAFVFVLMVSFVCGNLAFKDNSVNADDVSVSTSYYSLTYADNELKILLNPSLSAYTEFSKDDLSDLKDALIDVLKTIVLDDIVFAEESTPKARVRNNLLFSPSVRRNTPLPGIDVDLLKSILDNQLVDVETINNDLLSGNTYDLMVQFYVDRYVDSYVSENPGTTHQEVIEDIKETLVTTVTEKVNDTYTDAGYDNTTAINQEAVAATEDKINELLGVVSDMKDSGESIELSIGDVVDIINTIEVTDAVVDYVKTIDVKSEINTIITNSTTEEITSFFTDVDPSTIVTIVKEAEVLNKDDVTEIISSVGVDNFITIVESMSVDNLKELAEAVDMTRDELTDIISDHISEISISDIVKVFKSLTVNNHEIYNQGLNTSGIKALLKELPRFSEIATWSDEEMKYSFDVVVNTSFGDVSFKLTIGFDGDCSAIRRVASLLADHVSFNNVDGTYTLELLAPEKTASLINRLLESSYISDEIRTRLFDLFDGSVEELYNKFMDTSLDEYLELLKGVDYKALLQKALDADNWNKLLKTDKFTNERIDRAIDIALKLVRKLENYSYDDLLGIIGDFVDTSKLENDKVERVFNFIIKGLNKIDNGELSAAKLREFAYSDTSSNESIYSRIDKISEYSEYFDKVKTYAEKVYNKLPQRYKEKSLVEFYEENGTLNIGGTFNVDAAIDLLPERVQDALGVILDKLPSSLSLRLIVTVPHVYKVEYHAGSETKVGFLPAGATIDKYHGFTEINGCQIEKWIDENGNEVETMPEDNIVLYAVTEFFVNAGPNVSKVYDGEDAEIYVEVDPAGDYTYQWYKGEELIEGATQATYAVKDVNDSGEYKCVVNSENSSNESGVITVEITKAKINVSGYSWQEGKEFTYDGTEKEVLIPSVDEKLDATYTNNKKTDAGAYEASVAFAVKDAYKDNYELEGSVANVQWTILKAKINVSVYAWTENVAFTYDGSEKEVKLASAVDEKLDVTYTNNKKTNAGAYEASVAFAVKAAYASNYVVEGSVANLAWSIAKAKINVSGYSWQEGKEFTYDGSEKEVKLASAVDEKLDVTYANNKKTDAGAYEASVAFAVKEAYASNYEVEGSVANAQWTILKAKISVSAYAWTTDIAFTYDGSEKEVKLTSAVDEKLDATYANNKKTNAGAYEASVTFAVKEAYASNYEVEGSVANLAWSIAKAKINVSGYTWKTPVDSYYDNQLHKMTLVSYDEKLIPTYAGNEATVVGNYEASVTFGVKEEYASNYEVEGEVQKLSWKIMKGFIDVSLFKWNTTVNKYEYNGTAVTIELEAIDEHLIANYVDNVKTDAGSYTAKVTFTVKDAYKDLLEVSGSVADFAFEITKAKIDVSGYKWSTDNKFTYDGATHTLTLVGAVDEKIEATYTNNSHADAGNYAVSVSYALKDAYKANYEIVGSTADSTLTIEKAKIDVSGYLWTENTSFKYDGNEHKVELASAVDPKIDAHYANNAKTEEGEYVATVSFTLKSDYANNYEIVGEVAELNWKIEKDATPPTPEVIKDFPAYEGEDGESYIKIDALNGVPSDVILAVVEREVSPNVDINSVLSGNLRGKVFGAYDIHFEKDGEEIRVNDTFTIRMLIPVELQDKANIAVIHIADDGTVEMVDFVREDEFVVFTVSSFSIYAIMEVKEAPSWIIFVILGLLFIGLIVLIIFIILKRKEEEEKKNKTFFVKLVLCDKDTRNYYYELKDFIKAYSNKIEFVIDGLKEEVKVDEKTEVEFSVKNGDVYVTVYNGKESKKYKVYDEITVIRVKAILKKKFDAIDFSKVKSLIKQNKAKYRKEVEATPVQPVVEEEQPKQDESQDVEAGKTSLKITKKIRGKKK